MHDFGLLLRVLMAVTANMMVVMMSLVNAKGMELEQERKGIHAKS